MASEKVVILTKDNFEQEVLNSSQPVIVMEDRPEIGGVLVIAEGARDPKVREGIHTAVQTLLNIPSARITVVPMGGV